MASPAIGSLPGPAVRARKAQASWGARSLAERLSVIRNIRQQLAQSAADFLPLFPEGLQRDPVDTWTAELLPLADACRFLELEASRILASQKVSGRGRPWLFRSIGLQLRHEPFGVVLVIAPGNYPLFLPGVQTIQALAAGNAVIWKPGRGGRLVADAFALLARACGLPEDLLQVTDESVGAATACIAAGVDKIFITGSVESGQAVLHAAADAVVPVVAELSGRDAVVVLKSADVEKAARAVVFGLRLNGGETCIAPRRLFAHKDVAVAFERYLQRQAGDGMTVPRVLSFQDEQEMIALVNSASFGLGASVWGDQEAARRVASKIEAGVVVLNDVIVPTADPRVPFGGRKLSGYGTTRGSNGLLEMTTLKAIVEQRSRRLRHLEPVPVDASTLFLHYMAAVHSATNRLRMLSWGRLSRTVFNMRKAKR